MYLVDLSSRQPIWLRSVDKKTGENHEKQASNNVLVNAKAATIVQQVVVLNQDSDSPLSRKFITTSSGQCSASSLNISQTLQHLKIVEIKRAQF